MPTELFPAASNSAVAPWTGMLLSLAAPESAHANSTLSLSLTNPTDAKI